LLFLFYDSKSGALIFENGTMIHNEKNNQTINEHLLKKETFDKKLIEMHLK
jgi:hypothetical protein